MNNEKEQTEALISVLKEIKKSGHLTEFKAQLKKTFEYMKEEERQYANYTTNLSVFGNILNEDDIIILQRPQEDDREYVIAAAKEHSAMPFLYEIDVFCQIMWESHISDNELNYSIIRKADNKYIGFCGIKNVNIEVWEIAIELLSKYCHKGYGYRALDLFIHKTAKLSGKNTFLSKVKINNTASQALMEKLGFKPYGISKPVIDLKDEYSTTSESNLIDLAEKFHTRPEKLVGNILEYRLIITP